jgi:hypothetical protein
MESSRTPGEVSRGNLLHIPVAPTERYNDLCLPGPGLTRDQRSSQEPGPGATGWCINPMVFIRKWHLHNKLPCGIFICSSSPLPHTSVPLQDGYFSTEKKTRLHEIAIGLRLAPTKSTCHSPFKKIHAIHCDMHVLCCVRNIYHELFHHVCLTEQERPAKYLILAQTVRQPSEKLMQNHT